MGSVLSQLWTLAQEQSVQALGSDWRVGSLLALAGCVTVIACLGTGAYLATVMLRTPRWLRRGDASQRRSASPSKGRGAGTRDRT